MTSWNRRAGAARFACAAYARPGDATALAPGVVQHIAAVRVCVRALARSLFLALFLSRFRSLARALSLSRARSLARARSLCERARARGAQNVRARGSGLEKSHAPLTPFSRRLPGRLHRVLGSA